MAYELLDDLVLYQRDGRWVLRHDAESEDLLQFAGLEDALHWGRTIARMNSVTLRIRRDEPA